MKYKEHRALSFVIIAIVYVLATVLGVVVYNVLPFAMWLNILLADIAATIFMFLFSCLLKNASVYDPYWSVQPIVILLAIAFTYPLNVSGILLLIVICLWGIRLTANWVYTFKDLTTQDWRYTMLQKKTGKWYPMINFLGIHLVPTLVVYACTMPAVYVLTLAPAFQIRAILYVLLSTFAFVMQGIADVQMHRFRKRKTGGFMRDGLWKYARHPNYLGEILMWWGVGLTAVCLMPTAWYLIGGAVINTALFLFVSLPMAEQKQAKKPGFAEYKKQTHLLVPIKK